MVKVKGVVSGILERVIEKRTDIRITYSMVYCRYCTGISIVNMTVIIHFLETVCRGRDFAFHLLILKTCALSNENDVDYRYLFVYSYTSIHSL